jgi:hypothetical protein
MMEWRKKFISGDGGKLPNLKISSDCGGFANDERGDSYFQ